MMEEACQACGAEVLDIDVRCPECQAPLTSTGAQRLIGQYVLDQYEVLDVLGQGGMSVVYKGRHRLTDQAVALKILPPELAAHSQVKSRFLEEARALAQLDHPNIVHLYNFGQENGCFVLAMQYVDGVTWERMILEDEDLDWRRSVEVTLDVVKALEYAHSRGIVHRDMKPSNVLVRPDGSATVMDFGIAKMTTSTRLTATGQTMGTVRYMSPEQVRGQEVDHRTDIYSLACTLYESLLGDTPFDGDSHFEIMTKHLNETPASMRSQGAQIPIALENVVMTSLAKRMDERPNSAKRFREMLEAVLAGNVVPSAHADTEPEGAATPAPAAEITKPARPDSEVEKIARSRPLVWGGLGVAVLVASMVVFVIMGRGDDGKAVANPPPVTDTFKFWPDPKLLPDLTIKTDQRYEDDLVRVIATTEREPKFLLDAFKGAESRFKRYLRTKDVSDVTFQPVNLVMVPEHVLCDPRLYQKGQVDPDCHTMQSWYLPNEKTIYVSDKATDVEDAILDYVAMNICLHQQARDCEATLTEFRNDPNR